MNFSDKLKSLANNAVDFGKDIAVKGKGLAEQGKLALDNQKQQELIRQAQIQIGAYVAENNLLAEDETVIAQLSAIAAANEVIAKNNARIAELKTDASAATADADCVCEEDFCEKPATKFCTACGKEVDVDARFCPACGKQL